MVLILKGLFIMAKFLVKMVFTFILMDLLKEVLSKMAKWKDKANLSHEPGTLFMKGNGQMINPTEEEYKYIQMVLDMKEISLME